jgi:starvation-inducible outer membrane lipoprotein
MKTLIPLIATALALLVSACTTPPPIQGEFISKDGRIRMHPDGRIEIVVEPRTSK